MREDRVCVCSPLTVLQNGHHHLHSQSSCYHGQTWSADCALLIQGPIPSWLLTIPATKPMTQPHLTENMPEIFLNVFRSHLPVPRHHYRSNIPACVPGCWRTETILGQKPPRQLAWTVRTKQKNRKGMSPVLWKRSESREASSGRDASQQTCQSQELHLPQAVKWKTSVCIGTLRHLKLLTTKKEGSQQEKTNKTDLFY